ncbi:TrkA C-terminal domain-containing protein [Halorhabdus amylolytica]|uniref:TrkA C-terminal domain-containing protein n=1 Tax=Halorhabdus amylolytica TaxID=2559573 RepID=UPI001B7D8AE4|nr:TrkA C-terminal domain-containing protein [Halorhabdus amylolytica]
MIAPVEISVEVASVTILQMSGVTARLLDAAAQIGGLAVLAAAVAGAVAIAFRWYARERVSNPPAVLLGVAVVALYLNATTALGQVMGGEAVLSVRVALFNVIALFSGTVAALVGIAVGDRLARTVLGETGPVAVDESLGRVVRAVGRVITVELPTEIDDVPGYDPVDPDTKATLEGKTFVFPRGLTVEELRDRLARRLREDYRVGHVDLELDTDGTVTHLGLGSRAAGIGPSLPPESAAMAIRADPAHAASAGDLVQVWTRDPQTRLLNAEVRGTAGEIVTIAIDAADASKIDTDERYKLVTLPVEERADRELTELLRAADETLGVVEVREGSPLVGTPIGALDVTVVAVHAGGPEDRIEALPERDRVLAAGDSLYVIARPETIRRIESAADATHGVDERASSTIPPGAEPGRDPSATAPDQDSHGDESPSDLSGDETTSVTDDGTSEEASAVDPERTDEPSLEDDPERTAESTIEGEETGEVDEEPSEDSQERAGEDPSGGFEEHDAGQRSTGEFGVSPDGETDQTDEWTSEDIDQHEPSSEGAFEDLSEMDDLTDMEDLTDRDDPTDADDDLTDRDDLTDADDDLTDRDRE